MKSYEKLIIISRIASAQNRIHFDLAQVLYIHNSVGILQDITNARHATPRRSTRRQKLHPGRTIIDAAYNGRSKNQHIGVENCSGKIRKKGMMYWSVSESEPIMSLDIPKLSAVLECFLIC